MNPVVVFLPEDVPIDEIARQIAAPSGIVHVAGGAALTLDGRRRSFRRLDR